MADEIDKSRMNGLQLLFLDEIKNYIACTGNTICNYVPVVTKKHYSYKVEIKPDHANSYTVTAHIDPWEITIIFGGGHHHFTPSAEYEESNSKACDAAIAFIDGLLHGDCKVVINKANEKPYRWTFYCRYYGNWRFISTTGTLWYNYFGRHSREEIINKAAKK